MILIFWWKRRRESSPIYHRAAQLDSSRMLFVLRGSLRSVGPRNQNTAAMKSFDLCCCYREVFPSFCMRDMDLKKSMVRTDSTMTSRITKMTTFWGIFINHSFGYGCHLRLLCSSSVCEIGLLTRKRWRCVILLTSEKKFRRKLKTWTSFWRDLNLRFLNQR